MSASASWQPSRSCCGTAARFCWSRAAWASGTSLLEAACGRAAGLGHQVLRARGAELEGDFAFGIVRQLFERRLARAAATQRGEVLAGPAAAVRPLLLGEPDQVAAYDTSFAVLHGLYWLTANLANQQPLLMAVDDAHWADEPSLRWLAHLAPRLGELAVTLMVALRSVEPAPSGASLAALRAEASRTLRGWLRVIGRGARSRTGRCQRRPSRRQGPADSRTALANRESDPARPWS